MKNATELYIADLLARHIGGDGLPVKLAADALGVCESLIYAHRSIEGACPTVTQLFIYMDILPETFGNALIRLGRMTGAYRPKPLSDSSFHSVLTGMAKTGETFQRMSEAAADGVIDHMERRSLPPHLYAAASILSAVAYGLGEDA
jgi:hypothetical protein